MKRRILAFAVMAVMLCCGSVFAVAEESVQSRTITLLTHASLDTPSELSGVIGGLAEEYKALHPEFNLEYEIVPLTNMVGKVKTLVATESLPDIILYEPGIPLVELVETGKLVNLEEELVKMGVWDYVDPQVADLLKSMSVGLDEPLYTDTSMYIDWDVPSARIVDDEWPTPIVWVGCEVGYLHLSGRTFCEQTADDHPLRLAYRHFTKGGAHISGPQLAVLCALPAYSARILLSPPGRVLMNDEGLTEFFPYAGGRDRHVSAQTPEAVFRQIDDLLLAR